MHKSLVLLAAIIVLISGCGGGKGNVTGSTGDTPTTPSTTGEAQGVFMGTASNGNDFESIILPNDKFYALYGTISGDSFSVYGMITGQGASKNGSFSAGITDYYYTGANYTGTISATYVAGTSLNGTLSEPSGAGTLTFTGAPIPSSNFNYNTPAALSHIVGVWTGRFYDGTTAIVSVNSDGTFAGSASGCSFTGTITPDSSGKNFFNVSLTFGSSPCLLPGQTATGIALEGLLPNGYTRQLIVGGTAGNKAAVFFAQR